MMKVYGSEICKDCRAFKALMAERKFEAEFVDITSNTDNLREFLKLRDTLDIYREVRARNGIGIPLFMNGEEATLDVDTALAWIGQKPMEKEAACDSCK